MKQRDIKPQSDVCTLQHQLQQVTSLCAIAPNDEQIERLARTAIRTARVVIRGRRSRRST